ncbi:MAG TPA: phosphoribosylaminoimidazolesuccinocarboxamide synthase [Firmicutes bacterium]|nr:phosphoribosylaminoimidazolesuccinocarboxamide synthase [Bacillota bacterium]
MKKLYEGKAKIIYATENPDEVLIYYKDDATAFNGLKKDTIKGKGRYNLEISKIFFEYLEANGLKTHMVDVVDELTMRTKKTEIIKVEVVVRNIAAGSLCKRLGLPEGLELEKPILEFYYKDDALGDPLVNEYHIDALKVATQEELDEIAKQALKVNELLKEFLIKRDLLLVDYKLEFGRFKGEILLSDEISPDTCRFWDRDTRKKLDKDRFRQDLGEVTEAYQEILERISK